jgi:hypothetical protein
MFISESFKKSLKIPKWVIRNRKMEEGKTIQWLKVKWTTTTKEKEKKKKKRQTMFT